MFYRNHIEIPTKIKSHKNEIAPMIFFIDVIKSDNLSNPILPVPFRIDKVSNDQPSLLILPKNVINVTNNDEVITLNINRLMEFMLKNLLDYTKKKYREICFREYSNLNFIEWVEKSQNLKAYLPTFQQDLEYILREFLKAYIYYLNNHDSHEAILIYLMNVITYCNWRIDENKIIVRDGNKTLELPLYTKKKGKFEKTEILYNEQEILEREHQKHMNYIKYQRENQLLSNKPKSELTINQAQEKLSSASTKRKSDKQIFKKFLRKKQDNDPIKLYPTILEIDVEEQRINKHKKYAFVPILIYDDILECFLYTLQEIQTNKVKIISFEEMKANNIFISSKRSKNNKFMPQCDGKMEWNSIQYDKITAIDWKNIRDDT